jgi:hypothetical protein
MVVWGSLLSIPLSTVRHRGNRLGSPHNNTNKTGEEAGQPLAVRVGHRHVEMARSPRVGSYRAPSVASSRVQRGPQGAG